MDYSYKLSSKKIFYVLKQNDFKLRTIIQKGYSVDPKIKKMKEFESQAVDYKVSRKTFDEDTRNELLDRGFIVRIKSSDKRSNYYSITPLGILHVLKISSIYQDKVNTREQKKIFPILESFANHYVRPYNSKIFHDDKWDFKDFYNNYNKRIATDIGKEIPYVLEETVLDIFSNHLDIKVELLFERPFIISLALIHFENDYVNISELSNRVTKFGKYKPIKLSYEQFNQYLSRLLLSLIVYYHYVLNLIPSKKSKSIPYTKMPDSLQLIVLTFNLRIKEIIEEHQESLLEFKAEYFNHELM
jgi:hypothetical protein